MLVSRKRVAADQAEWEPDRCKRAVADPEWTDPHMLAPAGPEAYEEVQKTAAGPLPGPSISTPPPLGCLPRWMSSTTPFGTPQEGQGDHQQARSAVAEVVSQAAQQRQRTLEGLRLQSQPLHALTPMLSGPGQSAMPLHSMHPESLPLPVPAAPLQRQWSDDLPGGAAAEVRQWAVDQDSDSEEEQPCTPPGQQLEGCSGWGVCPPTPCKPRGRTRSRMFDPCWGREPVARTLVFAASPPPEAAVPQPAPQPQAHMVQRQQDAGPSLQQSAQLQTPPPTPRGYGATSLTTPPATAPARVATPIMPLFSPSGSRLAVRTSMQLLTAPASAQDGAWPNTSSQQLRFVR